jgi:hypothetical protein
VLVQNLQTVSATALLFFVCSGVYAGDLAVAKRQPLLQSDVQAFINKQDATEAQKKALTLFAMANQNIVEKSGAFNNPVNVEEQNVLLLGCLIDVAGYEEYEAYKLSDKIVALTFDSPRKMAAQHAFYKSISGSMIRALEPTKEACDSGNGTL